MASSGTFGQQSQEIILSERFVRVHRSVQGGTGPLINAGFPLPGSPLDPFTLCYSREEEETPEPEGSEFVKEIFVDGTGRSGWGNFKLTGRVRAWDGMISLVKEYVVSEVPSWSNARDIGVLEREAGVFVKIGRDELTSSFPFFRPRTRLETNL